MRLLKMDTGRWHTEACNYRNPHGHVLREAETLPADVDPSTLCRHCLETEYADRTES